MRVLVTGAGSGLGRALATRWSATGARVLVSDVDPAAAGAVAEELGQTSRALDVTSGADWESAVDWCRSTWDGLDVLVNNAGVGAGGRFERIAVEDWDWIWEVNLKGVVRGCRAFVPLFKEQGAGHVVNVASLAGLMNLPAMASYNVTKAGVISLSETLRLELEPYGVHTTVVCPGYFRTNLGERTRTPDPAVAKVMDKLMASSKVTAADVAGQVVDAVRDRRFLVLTHPAARRSIRLKRWLPKVVDREVRAYWARLRSTVEREDR
ncbi:SDR family oxidoreductase [Actinophytocola gossypii]|uniref:SDR family oxidoreductase n=1 Tax=Actinophytocola gossypii TaxID=2812003 RepID=A0ABT2JIU1_9PSEU|nr:SDR family oxidoreductase [Actinophytocola gossypii]MCT2587804.1 SDR family oxidoreductase [Actinophytocola gossypii]